ncbi:hypothetical protein J3A83DRAFT_4374875 [Scleroderma citrinum]
MVSWALWLNHDTKLFSQFAYQKWLPEVTSTLFSKNKPELEDIAHTLRFLEKGLKADLIEHIKTHLRDNPELQNDAHFSGLYSGHSHSSHQPQPAAPLLVHIPFLQNPLCSTNLLQLHYTLIHMVTLPIFSITDPSRLPIVPSQHLDYHTTALTHFSHDSINSHSALPFQYTPLHTDKHLAQPGSSWPLTHPLHSATSIDYYSSTSTDYNSNYANQY